MSPDTETIKELFEKYVESTLYDDVHPVRHIRAMEEQSAFDFPQYYNLIKKCEVKEMIKVGPYLITLNTAKVAHVYNRYERKLVGVLNSDILWDIKTLMYNAGRKAVIVIYVKRERSRRKSIQ